MHNNIIMMYRNENSRKIVFAIKRRQTLGTGGIRITTVRVSRGCKGGFVVCMLGVGGCLWQNHGTSPGGGHPVPAPLPFHFP